MIVKKMHEMGVRSEHAYMAAFASIGPTVAAWMTSLKAEPDSGLARADRWGIFVRVDSDVFRPRPRPGPVRAAGEHPHG